MVIYLEQGVKNSPIAQKIVERVKGRVIEIDHYKEIFNPRYNDFRLQKRHRALILAEKKGSFLYQGSPLCPNRGRPHFFYSSQILGCIFNCHYCYLGGLYPSGYPVIFTNLEKLKGEVLELPRDTFLAISYETDLLGFESIYPFHPFWIEIAQLRPDLLIESRTKSANTHLLPDNPPSNFLLSFSFTPEEVNRRWEGGVPTIDRRLEAVSTALKKGYRVEIVIEPILLFPNWESHYRHLFQKMAQKLPLRHLPISFGVYRLPTPILKKLRHRYPNILNFYPFQIQNGTATYPNSHQLLQKVKKFLDSFL